MSNNDKEELINNLKDIGRDFIGTQDYTEKYREEERTEKKTMAVLSYILPPIPFIAEKDSKYVKFHSIQGMNLLVWFIFLMLFVWVLDTALPAWEGITDFLNIITILSYIVLVVIGVINAVNNKAKELPIVSKLNFITIVSDFF